MRLYAREIFPSRYDRWMINLFKPLFDWCDERMIGSMSHTMFAICSVRWSSLPIWIKSRSPFTARLIIRCGPPVCNTAYSQTVENYRANHTRKKYTYSQLSPLPNEIFTSIIINAILRLARIIETRINAVSYNFSYNWGILIENEDAYIYIYVLKRN